MNYLLVKYFNHYAILNEDADFIVGRASPLNGQQGPFRVTADLRPDGETDAVAVVQSLDDAIPALAAFYKGNPPTWRYESATKYSKFTLFALLTVEQVAGGHWMAERDDHLLMRNGAPAIFPTCSEAEEAADAYLLDYYSGSNMVDDGLSWDPNPEIHWRLYPERVKDRAQALERASLNSPDPKANTASAGKY